MAPALAAGVAVRRRRPRRPAGAASAGARATARGSRRSAPACSRSTPGVEPLTAHAAVLPRARCRCWAGARACTCSCCVLRPVILRRRQEAPPDAVARAVREHGRDSLSAFAAQRRQAPPPGGRRPRAGGLRPAQRRRLRGGRPAVRARRPAAGRRATSSRTAAATAGRRASTRCPARAAGLPAARPAHAEDRGGGADRAAVVLLAGGKRAALRSMVHKVTRMGLGVRRYDRDACPDAAIDEQLEEISEEWLAEKPLGEMGFTRLALLARGAVRRLRVPVHGGRARSSRSPRGARTAAGRRPCST